jgi:hypothetical protein
MLLLLDIVIYFEAHTKDTNKLCEQNEEFCSLKHLVNTVTSAIYELMHSPIQRCRKHRSCFGENLRNFQKSKIFQNIRRNIAGNYFGKLTNSDLNMCANNFPFLFRSVNVSISTASSEFEKLFKDFLHERMFGKKLMCSLLKPSQIS